MRRCRSATPSSVTTSLSRPRINRVGICTPVLVGVCEGREFGRFGQHLECRGQQVGAPLGLFLVPTLGACISKCLSGRARRRGKAGTQPCARRSLRLKAFASKRFGFPLRTGAHAPVVYQPKFRLGHMPRRGHGRCPAELRKRRSPTGLRHPLLEHSYPRTKVVRAATASERPSVGHGRARGDEPARTPLGPPGRYEASTNDEPRHQPARPETRPNQRLYVPLGSPPSVAVGSTSTRAAHRSRAPQIES